MRWKRAAGTVAGTAAATLTVGVAAERYAMSRLRGRLDSGAVQRFHEERGRQLTVNSDDGVPMHVEIDGSDDADLTLVFCHGWTLQHASWYYQRRALGDLGRLVFWDQCGHGRSGRRLRGVVTVDAMAEDLRAVLDAVAPDGPVVLVGHSMGGMTIMALADDHPQLFDERVAGVALINTVAGGLCDLAGGAYGTALRTLVAPLLGGLGRVVKPVERVRAVSTMISYAWTQHLAFGSPEVRPELVNFLNGMISATPVDVVADYWPAIVAHDKRSALTMFRRVPTLVVNGTADKLVPPEASRIIAREVDNAELVEVPGAGHIVMLERPEVVSDALRTLVNRTRPVADLEATA